MKIFKYCVEKSGFLNLGSIDLWGWRILCWGGAGVGRGHPFECLAVSLVSTCEWVCCVPTPSSVQALTIGTYDSGLESRVFVDVIMVK